MDYVVNPQLHQANWGRMKLSMGMYGVAESYWSSSMLTTPIPCDFSAASSTAGGGDDLPQIEEELSGGADDDDVIVVIMSPHDSPKASGTEPDREFSPPWRGDMFNSEGGEDSNSGSKEDGQSDSGSKEDGQSEGVGGDGQDDRRRRRKKGRWA